MLKAVVPLWSGGAGFDSQKEENNARARVFLAPDSGEIAQPSGPLSHQACVCAANLTSIAHASETSSPAALDHPYCMSHWGLLYHKASQDAVHVTANQNHTTKLIGPSSDQYILPPSLSNGMNKTERQLGDSNQTRQQADCRSVNLRSDF